MKIFLRVLVVLILLLSGISLWLGLDLYEKREELKFRVLRFEEFTMRFQALLEAEPITDEIDPAYQLPKSMEEEFGFWDAFKAAGGVNLEAKVAPRIVIDRNALKNPYRRDKFIADEIQRDDLGNPYTDGPGTQDNELTNIAKKAEIQLDHLQETRTWLTRTREELMAMIDAHNVVYDKLQDALATIDRLNERVNVLMTDVSKRDRTIADLTGQNEQLEADIRDRDDQIAALGERVDELEAEVTLLDNKLKECYAKTAVIGREVDPDAVNTTMGSGYPTVVEQGIKGEILYVDRDAHFAIMSVDAESDLGVGTPLTAISAGATENDTPTGRLRVTDIRRDELKVVVDVIKDWDLKRGDIVLY